MKRYMNMALLYAVLAMVGGVFYREFTKFNGFTAKTTLSVVHTHYFLLGMVVFLLLLLLEKSFAFTGAKTGRVLAVYHVGLNLTADGVLHGLDVLGVHHAGEGAARQRDELLLVSAAEDAQAGLVDVDHRLVAIGMVDEKAAWHMSENVADVELG